jgi:Undecaprenyl-phosphate galactose phosphotransferase WbaP
MAFAYKEPGIASADRPALAGLDLARQVEATPGGGALGVPSRLIMLLSLILADALAIQGALYLGSEIHWMLAGSGPRALALDPRLPLAALALPLGYWLLDVYRVHAQAPIERFPLRIKATCVLFALLMVSYYATPSAQWPLAAIGIAFLFALVLPLVGEGVVRTILMRLGLWGVPAVVIGAGPTGQQVARILKQTPELGVRPVAFFDDSHIGRPSAMAVENVPLLGSIADSAKYSQRIDTAIVTTLVQSPETAGAVALQLGYRDIIVVPDLRDLPSLWVRTRDLNGLIGLQMRRNLLLRRNRLLKQTIDHLVALPLFIISVPIIAILALWVRAVSEGSPFYAQLRAGKDGRPIKVWKLRTMYPDAEERLEQHLRDNPSARQEWERYFKLADDPRILPGVGHFLRRTSLDELPQIFNVIRGEMSLVGPRPFPKYHLDRFDTSFQSLRSSVIPGITGLWQVSARSDGDLEVQQALDTYYIRNWSIWIDFYILSRTLGAVVAGRGAR